MAKAVNLERQQSELKRLYYQKEMATALETLRAATMTSESHSQIGIVKRLLGKPQSLNTCGE